MGHIPVRIKTPYNLYAESSAGPYNIRCTNIAPGLTQSELTSSISDPGLQQVIKDVMGIAIPAESIAQAVAYAINQPEAVDVNELIIRPTAQA